MMIPFFRVFTVFILFFISGVPFAAADVEWQETFSIDTGEAPLDAVVSEDGDRIFVLTEEGNVLIYASGGELEGTVHVGPHVDFITAGPEENLLLAGSANTQTLQTISLEFIHDIDVSGAPYMGAADAPVVISIFMDYQCPYCVRLKSILEDVLELNDGKVKVAYKQFPLKMHEAALSAAGAALVAFEAEKFEALHVLMEDDYKDLDDEKILDKAESLGFDRDAFKKKIVDQKILERIQQDIKDGKTAGVSGIPTVFINGRQLKKRSLEGFQELIDQEVERLARGKAAGNS